MFRVLFIAAFMTAVFTAADCTACGQGDDRARTTIERFYTEYLDALVRNDDVAVGRVEDKYLSRSLARRIRRMYGTMELDYNPFMQAQDFDSHSLDGMRIEKTGASENIYRVIMGEKIGAIVD